MLHQLQTKSANAIARRLTQAACDERRDEADRLMDTGVRFLQACRDVGMPKDYLSDTATGFRDQMENLLAQINRDLDDVRLWPAEPVCFGELDAFIGETL